MANGIDAGGGGNAERDFARIAREAPGASRATRIPSMRSKGSHRGWMLNTLSHHSMVFESQLEMFVALVLLARRDVLDLWDQPPAITYLDAAGELRRLTPDYVVTMVDGRRYLILVKPARKAARMDLAGLVRIIAPQVSKKIADGILIMTEAHVPRDLVADANLIDAARRMPSGPEDVLVEAIVEALRGAVTIGALIDATEMGGAAFPAVVRQIDRGRLRVVGGGIRRSSMVVPVHVVREDGRKERVVR